MKKMENSTAWILASILMTYGFSMRKEFPLQSSVLRQSKILGYVLLILILLFGSNNKQFLSLNYIYLNVILTLTWFSLTDRVFAASVLTMPLLVLLQLKYSTKVVMKSLVLYVCRESTCPAFGLKIYGVEIALQASWSCVLFIDCQSFVTYSILCAYIGPLVVNPPKLTIGICGCEFGGICNKGLVTLSRLKRSLHILTGETWMMAKTNGQANIVKLLIHVPKMCLGLDTKVFCALALLPFKDGPLHVIIFLSFMIFGLLHVNDVSSTLNHILRLGIVGRLISQSTRLMIPFRGVFHAFLPLMNFWFIGSWGEFSEHGFLTGGVHSSGFLHQLRFQHLNCTSISLLTLVQWFLSSPLEKGPNFCFEIWMCKLIFVMLNLLCRIRRGFEALNMSMSFSHMPLFLLGWIVRILLIVLAIPSKWYHWVFVLNSQMVHMRVNCYGIIFIQTLVFKGTSSVLGVVTVNATSVQGVSAFHVSRVLPVLFVVIVWSIR